MNSLSQELEDHPVRFRGTCTFDTLGQIGQMLNLVADGPKNPGQNEDENLVLEMSNFHFSYTNNSCISNIYCHFGMYFFE